MMSVVNSLALHCTYTFLKDKTNLSLKETRDDNRPQYKHYDMEIHVWQIYRL